MKTLITDKQMEQLIMYVVENVNKQTSKELSTNAYYIFDYFKVKPSFFVNNISAIKSLLVGLNPYYATAQVKRVFSYLVKKELKKQTTEPVKEENKTEPKDITIKVVRKNNEMTITTDMDTAITMLKSIGL